METLPVRKYLSDLAESWFGNSPWPWLWNWIIVGAVGPVVFSELMVGAQKFYVCRDLETPMPCRGIYVEGVVDDMR